MFCSKQAETKTPFGSSSSMKYPFLNESEEVLKELESGWQAVKHGQKFEWSKSMFRFELLRKPLLTSHRLILLNGNEVDFELSIDDITKVEEETNASGNPYLRMELSNEEIVSLVFVCVGVKMFLGAFYLLGKQKTIVNQWLQSINNLVMARKLQR